MAAPPPTKEGPKTNQNKTKVPRLATAEETDSSSSTKQRPKKSAIKVPKQKPIRFHRLYHGKTKKWRDNSEVDPSTPVERKNNSKKVSRLQPQKAKVSPSRLGGTDPFNALCLPSNSKTDLALHHWTSVFQNTKMPITPRKAWLNINLSDATLLSVTTYCSTSHFYFCRHMRAPPNCMDQKVLAIRNINNTLQKPGAIPSDYVMVAVAVMTLLECLAGSPKECAIHRKGLQLMLNRRGGLKSLGFNGAAERTISWADTCCSIFDRSIPTLRPTLVPNEGEKAFPLSFDIGDLRERLLPFSGSEDMTNDVLYVWLRLRYLSEFSTRNSDEVIDKCYFSDKLDILERRIISLLHSDRLHQSKAVAFITAFLNAALIYIYEELRDCPRWTNVCICLSQRIKSGLELVDVSPFINGIPDLLLWTMLLGRSGVSPLDLRAGPWFAEEISSIVDGFDGLKIPPTVRALMYYAIAEKARTPSTPRREPQ